MVGKLRACYHSGQQPHQPTLDSPCHTRLMAQLLYKASRCFRERKLCLSSPSKINDVKVFFEKPFDLFKAIMDLRYFIYSEKQKVVS